MNTKFEPGMRIAYDDKVKSVTVTFRGRVIQLDGRYDSEDQAVRAGLAYCRQHGWSNVAAPQSNARSMLRRRT